MNPRHLLKKRTGNSPQDKLKAETQEIRDLLVQIAQVTTTLETRKIPDFADDGDANRIKEDLQEIVRYTKNLR